MGRSQEGPRGEQTACCGRYLSPVAGQQMRMRVAEDRAAKAERDAAAAAKKRPPGGLG